MNHQNENWLREQIETLGRTFDEIAKQCNCTDENIKYFARKFGIKSKNPKHARRGRFVGDKSPNWRGGTQKYHWEWTEISENLRRIANYTCSHCGGQFLENKQYICVHHIDGNQRNNEISNLRVLCQACHRKAHSRGGLS